MDQHLIRAAMVGTTAAVCLAAALAMAACAVRIPASDFPAMKLTSPTASEGQPAK